MSILLAVALLAETSASVPVPEPSELALRFYRSGVALWCLNQAWMLLVPVVFLLTGMAARLRDLCWRVGRLWFFALTLFTAVCVVLEFLATLPLMYYEGFIRLHNYGLSTETTGHWVADALKGLAVSTVMAASFVWLPFLLIRRNPRRWWIYFSLGSVPVMLGLMMVAPVVLDPIFNTYGPMKDPALEARIRDLADRAGIEGGRIFEVDKSAETRSINAYVKGFAGTKRIVLWDTLLQRLNEPEVLFVMGHEMGHYVLGHVVRTILVGAVGLFLVLGMLHVLAHAAIRRFSRWLRIDRLDDFAALPLLVLLGNFLFLASSPAIMAYSRWQEHEADRFALEITRDNHAGATAFVAMQQANLGNPRPGWFAVLFRGSHPSLGDRIDFCNAYRPWETGEPGRYEHLFRGSPPR